MPSVLRSMKKTKFLILRVKMNLNLWVRICPITIACYNFFFVIHEFRNCFLNLNSLFSNYHQKRCTLRKPSLLVSIKDGNDGDSLFIGMCYALYVILLGLQIYIAFYYVCIAINIHMFNFCIFVYLCSAIFLPWPFSHLWELANNKLWTIMLELTKS